MRGLQHRDTGGQGHVTGDTGSLARGLYVRALSLMRWLYLPIWCLFPRLTEEEVKRFVGQVLVFELDKVF